MFNDIIIKGISLVSISGAGLASLITLSQVDLKSLIAYSRVSHMGLVLFSMLNNKSLSLLAGLIIILGHGIRRSGMFYLGTLTYERAGGRNLILGQGLIIRVPVLSLI